MALIINDCIICGEEPGFGSGGGTDEDGHPYHTVMLHCGDEQNDEMDHPFLEVSGTDIAEVIRTWNLLHPALTMQVYDDGVTEDDGEN